MFECKCYQITEKTDTEWDNIKCSRHGGRLGRPEANVKWRGHSGHGSEEWPGQGSSKC